MKIEYVSVQLSIEREGVFRDMNRFTITPHLWTLQNKLEGNDINPNDNIQIHDICVYSENSIN